MIEIGRLRLQLPAGFEQRAPRIARLVGDALAAQPVSRDQRIDALRVGPLHLDPKNSDHRVAGQIAQAIRAQLPRE